MSEVAVVVLAGGQGSRIGGGKPLRMLAGKSLIERALDHARRWSALVAVAVRDSGQAGALQVEEIRDDAGEGPLAGLAAALDFAARHGAGAVLTIPCDMPLLPHDLRSRLEAALSPQFHAALASSGGELHPVCGLWRVGARDQLDSYRAGGRASLRGFAEHVGCVAADWPVARYDPFLNINRMEQLDAADALLSALRSR